MTKYESNIREYLAGSWENVNMSSMGNFVFSGVRSLVLNKSGYFSEGGAAMLNSYSKDQFGMQSLSEQAYRETPPSNRGKWLVSGDTFKLQRDDGSTDMYTFELQDDGTLMLQPHSSPGQYLFYTKVGVSPNRNVETTYEPMSSKTKPSAMNYLVAAGLAAGLAALSRFLNKKPN